MLGKRKLATSQLVLRLMSCVCKLRFSFQFLFLGFYRYPDSNSLLFLIFPIHSLLILCKLSILTTLCLSISYLFVCCRHSITIIDIHWYASPNGPRGFNSLPCSDFMCGSQISQLLPIPCFFLDHWLVGLFPSSCSLQPPSLTCIPAIYPHPWFPYLMTTHNPGPLASTRLTDAHHWSQGLTWQGTVSVSHPSNAHFQFGNDLLIYPLFIRMYLVSAEDAEVRIPAPAPIFMGGQ